ncbi:hypothetical protein [Xanthocytophaga agilis]|uniref:Uncharacterized protein n=1 Tax=Xanthocytophaga agilis TaxID=3048010 RepID=A0AAE3UEP0_9BACT|nr:hypothetical protein [Xanthocytophaga agilis]MDJ1500477.1 hypothetical protein [Xanthocytophaga agilis]
MKKLDADDLLLLQMFLNIPAVLKKEDWHRECQTLQMKLQGAGDRGEIEDKDWDKAMEYMELHELALKRDREALKAKWG